jgi:CheY-like chemotaxis protein
VSAATVASKHKAVILLVEDSEADVELTQISIQQTGRDIDLHVVRDGEQCMGFLLKLGQFHDAPTPQLVLLDLHMPRMNGLEVLASINSRRELRSVPVVVLTTSNSRSDVNEAYARHCSGYVIKPMGFSDFSKAIESLLAYWLSLVVLPDSPKI